MPMTLRMNVVYRNGSIVRWKVLFGCQRHPSLKRYPNLPIGVLWPHIFPKLGRGLHIGAIREAR